MTRDLFSIPSIDTAAALLLERFEAYVAQRARSRSRAKAVRPLREESAAMYRDIWRSFAVFCAHRELTLDALTRSQVEAFLDSLGHGAGVTPRYVRRVLSLLERVVRFDAQQRGVEGTAALASLLDDPRYKTADLDLEEPLPAFLTALDSAKLQDWVTRRQVRPTAAEAWDWREVRDRTAVAVQLGGGLSPSEVRALVLAGVVSDGGFEKGTPWKLSLPGNGNYPARETPLTKWAGQQLRVWLTVRAEQGIAGEIVFPATRSGKVWGKTASFNAFGAVLAGAKIKDLTGGSYKLRHTFALRQLADGRSATEVAHWLGVKDPAVMQRYSRVLIQPVVVI